MLNRAIFHIYCTCYFCAAVKHLVTLVLKEESYFNFRYFKCSLLIILEYFYLRNIYISGLLLVFLLVVLLLFLK